MKTSKIRIGKREQDTMDIYSVRSMKSETLNTRDGVTFLSIVCEQ